MAKVKTKKPPKRIIRGWQKRFKKFERGVKQNGCLGSFPECPDTVPQSIDEINVECKICPYKENLLKAIRSTSSDLKPKGERKMEKEKIVCILSGGMDSTTMVYKLINDGYDVHCLSFNYGQKHSKELEYARKTIEKLGLNHKIVDISSIHEAVMSQNSLTGDMKVPEGHYAEESMKATVVPFRNAIFLMIASGYASTMKINKLAYGAHKGDHAIYPDCRSEFVEAISKVMVVGDYEKIELMTPFLNMTKSNIMTEGIKLKVPYEDTWSCYVGKERPCFKCGTCVERNESFFDNNIKDPLATDQEWEEAIEYMKEQLEKNK